MTNSTPTETTVSCSLTSLLGEHKNAKSLLGITVLIGAEFIPTIFTIAANATILWTIARTASLRTPSNTLLAALCSSDLCIGLITHPMFIAMLIYLQLLREPSSAQLLVLKWSGRISSSISLLTVFFITLDRYVAICCPFLYERQATVKKHIITVALTWVFNIVIIILSKAAYTMYYGTVTVIAFGVIIYCYVRIHLVIVQKEKAMFAIGTIGDADRDAIRNNREERRKSYTIIILLAVFTMSYLPTLAVALTVYGKYNGARVCNLPPNMAVAFMWSLFFLTLSSMLNPIVYCIFIKQIRKAALRLFCKCKNVVAPF